MNDLQQLAYEYAFNLAMFALNPGYAYDPENPVLPTIPVIQDQQDESAPTPTGTYIAIQGSPTMDPFGTPNIEAQDGTGLRGYVQHYTATIVFWEVNGNGSKLNAIRETSFLTSAQDALSSSYVTFLDTTPVADVSYKLDNAWKMQSRMQMTLSVASRITETLSFIETVETHEV